MSELSPDEKLLNELEPTAVKLLDRHLSVAKEWFPYEMVPWSQGENFVPPTEVSDETNIYPDAAVLGITPSQLAVQRSMFLNILTEDNLPHYYRQINSKFGNDKVWGEWNRRWTAEEGRHAIVMRDYLCVMRFPGIDLRLLERARMKQVSGGVVPDPPTIADGIVYVALQELATRISHRNTGKLLEDKAGQDIMERVARDENLHHLFYRDLVAAALEIDPSGMIEAIDRQVTDFDMPGTDVETFINDARLIGKVGIYGVPEFRDEVVIPTLSTYWGIWDKTGLSASAEHARDNTSTFIERLEIGVKREKQLRERFQAAA